jgi:SAGA-associated factor 73
VVSQPGLDLYRKPNLISNLDFTLATAPPPKTDENENTEEKPFHFVTPMDGRITPSFPAGKPFEDEPEKVNCKHCRRPLFKALAADHVRECLRVKQEKQQRKKENKAKKARDAADNASQIGDDGDSIIVGGDDKGIKKNARKTAGKATASDDKKTGKKRKADGEADKSGPSKKKRKDEALKVKAAKPKAPVDVEKQCGVLLPNGAQCARSLTCKSHSMGAKRAVVRSLPYDMLLVQYQKKSHATKQRLFLRFILRFSEFLNWIS